MSLRLASFNLLSGRSLADGSADSNRLIEAITALDADILAIQEVDRFQPRSGGVDQAAAIAKAMGAVSSRFVPTVDGTPGEPGWAPADGTTGIATGEGAQAAYGVALISRLPVDEWHVLRLRQARGRFPLAIPTNPPQLRWLPDEPRAVIAAVLAEPRLTIGCTHLSFVPLVNVRQLLRVRQWLAELPGPQVLMGDLNLPGATARWITHWTPLVSAPTYPSPAPKIQLDHILGSGLPAGVRASGRVRTMPISDHRAVLVDLELPD